MTKTNAYYIPALDGMRALSILLVLFAHLGFEDKVPGGLGVNIFFFISGFLITNLLLIEYSKNHEISLKNFYIRRVLRLYPPLLLMILLVSSLPALNQNLSAKEIFAALFYYENYYYIKHFDLIQKGIEGSKFRIIWSLSIEEHFYLFFPFLFALTVNRKKWLIALTVLIILAALFLRIYIAFIYNVNAYSDNYTYEATTCRVDSIMVGCLSSIILFIDKKKLYLKIVGMAPVFILGILIMFFSLIYRNEFFRQTFRYSLQSFSLFLIVPPIIYLREYNFFNKILSTKPLVFIGKLSYSLYLLHLASYGLVRSYIINNTQNIAYYITCLLAAFVLALLSYNLVEKPVMQLRKKFSFIK